MSINITAGTQGTEPETGWLYQLSILGLNSFSKLKKHQTSTNCAKSQQHDIRKRHFYRYGWILTLEVTRAGPAGLHLRTKAESELACVPNRCLLAAISAGLQLSWTRAVMSRSPGSRLYPWLCVAHIRGQGKTLSASRREEEWRSPEETTWKGVTGRTGETGGIIGC